MQLHLLFDPTSRFSGSKSGGFIARVAQLWRFGLSWAYNVVLAMQVGQPGEKELTVRQINVSRQTPLEQPSKSSHKRDIHVEP